VIAKWTVAREKYKKLIGYPCDDFKFRAEEQQILASWDEMGHIRDLEGNIVD
jgi:hypothetical protein